MFNKLEALIRVPGISGYEEPICHYIAQEVIKLGLTSRVDALGNLITEIGIGDKSVVLIAHMDELGLIVSYVEDNGYLRFRKVGGTDDRTLIGRAVELLTENGVVLGVIGIKPPHLMSDRSEQLKTVSSDELYIDIGTRSRKESNALGVDILTPAVLQKQFNILNGEYISARGVDDRFGCLVLLEVLASLKNLDLPYRLIFVWSVKEEIGLHGAKGIASTIKPDLCIAVDVFTAADMPGIPFHLAPARLGEGPVLRVVDNRAMADPQLRKFFQEICRGNDIPLQVAMTGGGTDGAELQATGIRMIPVSVPIRYMHSPVEMIHIRDLEQLIKMLTLGLQEIQQLF